jgi:hypothetical protein
MDQSLSSLYPIHQIGSDGFSWWIGQVETNKKDDPKRSGRYRVRIIGQHLKTGDNATSTQELPWAHIMMPVTTPFIEGGTGGASPGLQRGCFVVGFYLDNDKQKPVIMGSIGGVKGATKDSFQDDNPSAPLNFKPVIDPKTNPKQNRSADTQSGKNKSGANTDKGVVDADKADLKDGAPPILLAAYAKHSETNPTGGKSCIVVANPNCGQENNLRSGLTRIVGDLLAANQASGGNIGDFYVSKINGLLYNGVGQARYHISRVVRLVKSFIARGKTEITKALRGAIDFLNKTLLTTEAVVGNTGPLADPDKAFKPITEKSNRLKTVKKIFDDIFGALGCSIADITDTIARFITDLLMGFIQDVFNNAACFIDTLVDGILNEILAKFDELVNVILAPIQAILEAIAAPLNFIGGIINKFMKLLGITCTGPGQKCEPIQQKCTDCGNEEDDSLDKLLKALESGVGDESAFICDEAKQVPSKKPTEISFVGGVPDDLSPSPENTPPSGDAVIDFPIPEIDLDEDFDDDPIDEDNLPDDGSIIFPDPDDDGLPTLPLGNEPFIEVYTESNLYNEGDTIVYNLTGVNIPDGTQFDYELSGPTITQGDIDGSLTGEFTVTNNTATVSVVLATDEEVEQAPELLIFTATTKTPIILDTDNDGTTEEFPLTTSTDVAIDSDVNDPVSPDPSQVAVWNLTTDKNSYQEGEDVLVTVTTQYVADNTEVDYYIIGSGITAEDFVSRTLSGTLVIKNGAAAFVIGIEDDSTVEGIENATIILASKGVSTSFSITEAGGEEDEVIDDNNDDDFTIKKPIAGDIVTDNTGAIVEIPIKVPGGPYQTAPQIIITGDGYGSGAVALLNDKGFVTEVRVTRQGINYVPNTADENNLQCVVDSFTLLSPGSGYTEAPVVLINGVKDIAEAIIDQRGFVVSIRTLDRSKRYTDMPTVTLLGGGGGGARFLPNMVCLDSNELERKGYAKIGTGSYVDCP